MAQNCTDFKRLSAFHSLRKAAFRARKGTRNNPESAAFWNDLETNIWRLQQELQSKSYQPRPFRHFKIKDPKPRGIQAADFRDRVIHHALCAELEPILEADAHPASFACRKGKGSHAAIQAAQKHAQQFKWFAKVDIHHCFETLHHGALLNYLTSRHIDDDTLWLCRRILEHGASRPGRGLPIGNLSSQHFANAALTPLDHWYTRTFGDSGYLRYMDDVLIFGQQKSTVKSHLQEISLFIENKLLQCPKYDAFRLAPSHVGVPFLGFRIWPAHRRLDQARKKRLRRSLRWNTDASGVRAQLAWAHQANSHRLTQNFFSPCSKAALPNMDTARTG